MHIFDFDDLPPARDGRAAFSVTDAGLDAPDGAVLDLTGDVEFPERQGHFQRHGDRWVPVEPEPNGGSK